MNKNPLRILVDTNVWIGNYCGWHGSSAACRVFIKASVNDDAELYYPVHVLKDVLYVVTAEYKRRTVELAGSLTQSNLRAIQEVALGCMRNMFELATAVGADGSDLWLADKYLVIHPDFEDNLVLAACKRVKADYLVTSDQKLIRNADVLAKTPDQMLKLMSIGSHPF